ncbi:MAG: hypothetical protein J0H74_15945 [Chitinophagaceae bacterium]|nr:hypothetical protein [Chitinophagaceae bacterium]
MISTLLFKSIVRTFYRQNAGQLAFLFFIMVLAVGRANDVGLLEYHYSLIQGMLTNPSFLCVVLLAWSVYAWKCIRFVTFILQRPEFSFLSLLSLPGAGRVYWSLLFVQGMLFLPVSLYAVIILGVGIHAHWYVPTMAVLVYVLAVCGISAVWYLRLLYIPGMSVRGPGWGRLPLRRERSYRGFLTRYVLTTRKTLLLVIKLYSCGVLYLIMRGNAPDRYDLQMVLLFYSFGLLGHGVLIHLVKRMEATRLDFYRGMAVSLRGRFIQYGWFYLTLLVPEILTIGWFTPGALRYSDALLLVLWSYSILLLLNSLQLYPFHRMIDYLKVVGCIFFVIYLGVLMGVWFWLTLLFLSLSVAIFWGRYYRRE